MSAVNDTTATPTAAAPAETVVEQVMTDTTPSAPVQDTATSTTEAVPATAATTTEASKPEEPVAAAAPTTTEGEATTVPATEAAVAEPLLEGILGYKAPGLLKQFTFSKKDFWLNDAAVTPQKLGLYLRGEKSEVSHPVTAWASQTGKGLLFFNKKDNSDRTQPAGVIALYDATDLKKASPHEFAFEISGHKHSFKASTDAERDGWYQSIEKSIELGKASKESVRDSEGYKAEMDKLNTPNHIGGGAVGAAKARSQSQPKKSIEGDAAEPTRTGSSDGDDEELKKKNKSRSTSRGMLNRLKGKKEEAEVKKEEKKDEKAAEKEEKAVEKEINKTDEATPAAAPAAVVAPVAAAAAPIGTASTSEAPAVESSNIHEPTVASTSAAPVEEKPIEALPVAAETKTEEKPKPAKRSSIFGKLPSAWGNLKSPNKEKSEKDAELKPEVPAKDATVADAAPQLPETTTTEPIETPIVAPTTDATKPEITETAPDASKTNEVLTPNKEKKNFLSGLSFMNKRDRSVSPSAAAKEQPKTETPAVAPVAPVKEEVAPVEPSTVEEPTVEATPTTVPATTETAEKPVEKVEEPKAVDATSPTGNKRQSMLGNLGRRASKALNLNRPSKKENTTPVAGTAEETTTTPVAAEKKAEENTTPVVSDPQTVAERATGAPVVSTEENKPEAVGTTQPAPVAASA